MGRCFFLARMMGILPDIGRIVPLVRHCARCDHPLRCKRRSGVCCSYCATTQCRAQARSGRKAGSPCPHGALRSEHPGASCGYCEVPARYGPKTAVTSGSFGRAPARHSLSCGFASRLKHSCRSGSDAKDDTIATGRHRALAMPEIGTVSSQFLRCPLPRPVKGVHEAQLWAPHSSLDGEQG